MGSLAQRRTGLKTVWRDLSARAQRGEAFGWIKAVVEMWNRGHFPNREAAIEMLRQGSSADDLREYRRIFGDQIF